MIISSKFLKVGYFPFVQINFFIYQNQFKANSWFSWYKKNSLKQSLVKIRILLHKGFQFIGCSLIYGFFECFECAIHFTLSTKGVLFCPYCLPFFDWSFSQWCQQKTTLAQQFGTLIVFTNFYVSPYFWAMVLCLSLLSSWIFAWIWFNLHIKMIFSERATKFEK